MLGLDVRVGVKVRRYRDVVDVDEGRHGEPRGVRQHVDDGLPAES